MTQAPTPGPLWMMHVIGPDDIYPAPNHSTAVEWCAELNASMPASDVLCVAVPAIWIGTPEAHAEGLSEAVEDWTSPRQRLAPTAPVASGGQHSSGEAKGAWVFNAPYLQQGLEAISAIPTPVAETAGEAVGVVSGRARADLYTADLPTGTSLYAAPVPASPLPEGGGPTCQVCGGKIEAWTCQGCGAQFYENDAGALVLGVPAAPTGAK